MSNNWNCNNHIRTRRNMVLMDTDRRKSSKMRFKEAAQKMRYIAVNSSGERRREAIKDMRYFISRYKRLK